MLVFKEPLLIHHFFILGWEAMAFNMPLYKLEVTIPFRKCEGLAFLHSLSQTPRQEWTIKSHVAKYQKRRVGV